MPQASQEQMNGKQSARYSRSAELHMRACGVLAGGVSSQFRALSAPHPMFYTHAKGSRIWDVDGNELVDFTLSQGPCILGHSHPRLLERLAVELSKGQLFAGQYLDELELGEHIQRLVPSAELVRFSVSGSEAAHALLRLARHVTGRRKIVKFVGHYHGWLDNVSFSVAPPEPSGNEPVRPVVWGGGVPAELADSLIVLPWNDIALVEQVLARQGDEIAAIITEPVMCNQGCIEPVPGFLQGLRDLCDRHDIALIFDEIITGFRLDLGGAQEHYGVTPDMSLFGKALGAGFPLSALVGKERFLSPLARGEVYHAGTLNGNTASVTAGLVAVELLEENGRAGHAHIVRLGRMLRDGLAEIGARHGGILVQGPGPMFHMGFTAREHVRNYDHVLDYDKARYREFSEKMLARGVRLIERGLWYVSLAHSDADIRFALSAAEASLEDMKL